MKNLKIVLASLFMFALVFASAGKVHAAADIAVASAKVTSANTVLVTFANPGQNLASTVAADYHIDINTGGSSPLTPSTAVVTSATLWTVTLTFSGTPFSATNTTFDASHGLYLDTGAVTDTNADTNVVVGHAASTAITDAQLPTFTAQRTAVNTVVLTFSEAVDASDTATAAWTVSGATVSAVTDPANSTTLTITTTGQTSTAGTVTVNYVAASGTVVDAAANEVADGGAVVASDHVPPTLAVTMSDTDLSGGDTSTVTFTFSEAPTGFTSADVTVGHGTLGAIDATNPLVQTAVFTPDNVTTTDIIEVGTGWTDSSAALNAPAAVSDSASYTITSTGSSSGGHHSGSHSGGGSSSILVPAPTTPATPGVCPNGMTFASNCMTAPAAPAAGNCPNGMTMASNCMTAPSNTTIVLPSQGGSFNYAFGTTTIKLGSTGAACKVWQTFFNDKGHAGLVVDGNCGPKTIAFAKTWQASVGLKVDGMLGAMSREKAMAAY